MNPEFGKKKFGLLTIKNALQPGTRLQGGKYILIEVYAQGPFTTCYLARQNILDKKVIINEFFLLEHCSHSPENEVVNNDIDKDIYHQFRERWFEEAILLSKCSGNEHFVTVLDAFEENNTAYYVTDYVNEDDLRTFLLAREGKFPGEADAVELIRQISDGLSFLHSNNIFHLNLSPIKVLISKKGRAVIFSVGIARQYIPVEIIRDITILTKPGYSSPELYSLERENGRLADIYSLGAILYFLVTGKDPSPAPERIHQPMPEPKTLNPALSRKTNTVILKAMAMAPQDRYQNLDDFLEDLKEVHVSPVFSKTKRITLVAAAILLLLAAGTYFIAGMFLHQKPGKPTPEMAAQQKTGRMQKLAQLSLNEDKTRGVTLLKDPAAKDSVVVGKYYALLIGIQNYTDNRYQALTEPVSDVNSLNDILVNYYTFDKDRVTISKDPDKKEIFRILNYYRDNLTPNDNLFVFYAGHGRYDKKSDMGYIIPADGDYKNDADWISFQEIREKFRIIPAKHILLIADACFAGSVFRGEESDTEEGIDEMTLEQLNRKSRIAFTSAYLKPVPDRSDFLKQLISNLKTNTTKLFLSEDLYINTRNSLIRSTSKKDPVKYGVIRDCGDEGGDFIFIRRTNEPR
jgi:serine/threonine protein kinase